MFADKLVFVKNETDEDYPAYDIHRGDSITVFGAVWYGSQSGDWFMTPRGGEETFDYHGIKQIYKFMKQLKKKGDYVTSKKLGGMDC